MVGDLSVFPIRAAVARPAETAGVSARPAASGSVRARIASREYPSVFRPWSSAQHLNEDPDITFARHDLAIKGPNAFGLWWNSRYPGEGNDFLPETLAAAREARARLLKLNPHLLLIAEIRYRDAPEGPFPTGSGRYMHILAAN